MLVCLVFLTAFASASAGTATESYKNQFCTDPRTMDKYEAYTEWADAYSCSRHRCQPGGRNLAIYTVGCKRVEAPESAIECEEVVEDTNMQFPFCCTRLRCLVVVRGEVWTRVLGQPWETLPAAPWSHMYKMKKPPPSSNAFASKTAGQGPIYELQSEPETPHEKVLRSSKNQATVAPDCNDPVPRVAPSPDIVIALATTNEEKEHKKTKNTRHKRVKKPSIFEEETEKEHNEVDFEDAPVSEKNPEASDEKALSNSFVTQKTLSKSSWTEIPSNQWTENDPSVDVENHPPSDEKEKPALQALVDAIGSRMRDIESVVQRMSEKVHDAEQTNSEEKRTEPEAPRKHHKADTKEPKEPGKLKKPNTDNDNYKRFSVKNRSKYLHTAEVTSEQPLFVEDTNLNGYFSDASNSLVRRANQPKEPATYMAPVDNRRKAHTVETSDEGDKKHKKHTHKKRRKGKSHKKHHGKDDKRKRINRLTSIEMDKNVISLEDSAINK